MLMRKMKQIQCKNYESFKNVVVYLYTITIYINSQFAKLNYEWKKLKRMMLGIMLL